MPPGDWCGPVPVPFLVVAPQTTFAFALLPARGDGNTTLPEVAAWLRAFLEDAGAGGKTTVGYGRFRLDERETDNWRKRIEDALAAESEGARRAEMMKTPEGRWQVELQRKTEQEILELVRVHLSKKPLSDPEARRVFAKAVVATGLPAIWRKGGKREPLTQLGAAKLKERARLLERDRNAPRSMDWDPAADTPGSVYTGYTRGFLPVAEWLAFRGLVCFPITGVGEKLRTTACSGRRLSGKFVWPLWEVPAGPATVRSLIAYPGLDRLDSAARQVLGIAAVLRAGLTKKADGYSGMFSPAQPA